MRKYRSALFPATVVLITIVLWLLAKRELGWPSSPLLAITQITALLAITFLALQYFVATRSRLVEKIFDGLDVAYIAHHNMGGIAFILMLTHPILLFINALPSTSAFALYFLPNSLPSYSAGIIALYTYTILLLITYLAKIPYHIWKATHRFMLLPMTFVVVHVIQISSDISRYMPLRYWILSLAFLGLGFALYRSFLYKYFVKSHSYVVTKLQDLGEIMEVYVKPDGDKERGIRPQPGQFVFLRFTNSKLTKEEHPFSISKVYDDGTLRISMKKVGDYTNNIVNAKVGDSIQIVGPFGRFGENLLVDGKDMIWVAGGIGITPFLTMLEDEIKRGGGRKITLYYTITSDDEANYIEYLKDISKGMNNIQIIPHVSSKKGRLTVQDISNEIEDVRMRKVFMCGPREMMDQFTSEFVRNGVKPWNIIKEDFNLKR